MVLVLGFVQLGSDGVFSSAGSKGSVPARVTPAFGVAIYRAIDRIAPAPYVDSMLARAALERGDLVQAQQYAQRLPDSPRRNDLLGRISRARGDLGAAESYFIAADDIFAIDEEVQQLAVRDPAAAYRMELRLVTRLGRSATHPDALAESYWTLGVLAARSGRPALAIRHYRYAVELSPLSAKYLISAGFQSYDLHRYAAAQEYFRRAIGVDPGSADAYAGAGMTAFRQGDLAAARAYAARSRACDPHSHALKTLEDLLR